MILALRALGLGDLLTAVPALRALRRAHPDEPLVLATPGSLAALARHATAVDTVVPTEGITHALARHMHGATLAVNLHGRGPESTALLAATHPRRLTAFDAPGSPSWRDDEHDRDRWCRLLVEAGVVASADPTDLRIEPPATAAPAGAGGATVIHPGAASAARRWPAARWAAVARAEVEAGRLVVVTGSAAEAPLAHQVAARAGLAEEAVLAGRTDVMALLRVVGLAGRVVCGDTGVAHVASALGTPSVVLFGPVPPAQWGPPVDGPHVVLWHGTTGDPHASVPDAGLLAIDVDDVLAALERLDGHAAARPTVGC